MSKHWTDKLVAMSGCPNAVGWARDYPSLTAAWKACERADWMLWLAGRLCRTVLQRKRLVLAACACARTALKYVPRGENRPLAAICTAERWARGTHGVTPEDVRAAWAAAGAAANDAAAWAAGAAAWAAARAAAGAAANDAAAWAAGAAAGAAGRAGGRHRDGAHPAAWDARSKVLARMSNIVRKHYPIPPRLGRRG